MAYSQIKIIKGTSHVEVERDFNTWASEQKVTIHQHMIEYSSSLQKFILTAVYDVTNTDVDPT